MAPTPFGQVHSKSNSTITKEATLRNLSLFATVTGGLVALLVHSSAANAQATRTWVSGVGDDVNPCSRTAPCKTFAGAISKTAVNGEINCLDPAGYGALTITKSITVNCFYTDGSILNAGTNGINVNITSATDALKTARLVGININGSSGGTRSGVNGINILAATAVFVEEVLITDQTQVGIKDTRTVANGSVFIKNSTVRNNGGAGLQIIPTAATNLVVDNVKSLFNSNGIGVGPNTKAVISRSVFSGNTASGVQSDPGGTSSVDSNIISHNGTGITVVAGGSMRLSNNDITLNANGISGTTNSFGNNRISANTAAGTAPTTSGGDTNPKSQQ
jgi:hypothetical protein